MTKAPNRLTSLLHRLGVAGPARVCASEGISASKATQGITTPSPTPALTTLATIAATLLASAGLAAALPAAAGAYATPAPENVYSSAPGLPDGRVYEQVSPADKNGNEAGAALTLPAQDPGGEQRYALAAPDGNSVLFEGTGPMGEAATPLNPYFVATKNQGAAGWTTRGITPAPEQTVAELGGVLTKLGSVYPSSDLSHVLFAARGSYAPDVPGECGEGGKGTTYLGGPDPFGPAAWLARPQNSSLGETCTVAVPAGGSQDFSTVYFASPDQLLPEDASRASHAEAWGFYEYAEGALHEAGVLPDGGLDPFGAVPAASAHGDRIEAGNQVSADGSRAFFVSPDPASCEANGGHNNCALDPPELYVRENGTTTVLVSKDTLLPEAGGLPVGAPEGVSRMLAPGIHGTGGSVGEPVESIEEGSYVFASPDGSNAFFQSTDDLTEAAQQAGSGSEPKTYDFDVDTGTLTYLPNVVMRQILATDADGSSFAFVKPEAGGAPAELDLWSAGSDGGSVIPVTQLPGPPSSGGDFQHYGKVYVFEARMSSDGSVLVFLTRTVLPGGFNDGGGYEQIYRYDVPANTLGCVSCPPHGVTPNGNAVMSTRQISETEQLYQNAGQVNERGISSDGSRIFFDTPAPLVPQDTNTETAYKRYDGSAEYLEPQGRDVYEWENGVVYLISSGKSSLDSYFLDNSENGDDVFFTTTESLVPGDTDGAYDVYDARVPHPGDNPPPAAVPCEGSVCQGPPNVPAPLTPPASATFSGLGNPPPEPAVTTAETRKTTTKTVKCKKGDVKKKNKCVKVKSKKKAKKAGNKRGAKS